MLLVYVCMMVASSLEMYRFVTAVNFYATYSNSFLNGNIMGAPLVYNTLQKYLMDAGSQTERNQTRKRGQQLGI